MLKIKPYYRLMQIDEVEEKFILHFFASKINIKLVELSKKEYKIFSDFNLSKHIPETSEWETIKNKLQEKNILEKSDNFIFKFEELYNRHNQFLDSSFDNFNLSKLKDKTVLIAGCGGIGNNIIIELLRLNVKNIILVDDDEIEESNLTRQIIFTFDDVGKYKIDIMEKYIKSWDKEIYVEKHLKKFSSNIVLSKFPDFAFVSADSPQSIAIEAYNFFTEKKIPYIHAGYINDFISVGPIIFEKNTQYEKALNIHVKNKSIYKINSWYQSPSFLGINKISSSIAIKEFLCFLFDKKNAQTINKKILINFWDFNIQEYFFKNKVVIGIYNSSTPIISIFPNKCKRSETFLKNNGFDVIHGYLSFTNKNYRTGTALERANEINKLVNDENIDILMSSIGGNNTSSILEYLDYEKIGKSKIKIIGHSDTTALILAIYTITKKITYYSSSFILGFDNQEDINDFHLKSLIDNCINDKLGLLIIPDKYTSQFIPWSDDEPVPNKEMKKNKMITLVEGVVEGVLIGGNLNTFIPMINTKYFPKIDDKTILFFEDTCSNNNLNLAQIEKNFASLRNSGILHKVGGLIIGKCEGFEEISNGIKYYDFIKEFIYDLKIPILAEFDFSHTLPIVTIAIGSTVKLNTIEQTLLRIK